MHPGSGPRPGPAPAKLALGATILILLAGLAPAQPVSARRARPAPAAEAPSAPAAAPAVPAPGAGFAEQPPGSERTGRHARRTPASAPAAEAPAAPAAAVPRAAARQAERRAQRAAERAARREGAGAGAGAPAAAGPQASAGGAPKTRGEREQRAREREREQRMREHEHELRAREREGRRGEHGGAHETRREREAREAREAAERQAGSGSSAAGPVTAAAASVAAPAAAQAAPAPAGGITAPASVARDAGSRATGGARARHRAGGGRPGRAGSGAATAAPAAAAALAPVAAEATSRAGRRIAEHPPAARVAHNTKASPIVTTVTRIIGVIPTLVWALIGALAAVAAAFALSSRLSARRAARLARQRRELLEDVGLLQAALLPELPAKVAGLATTAAYRPASGPGAGGDFYDVFVLGNGRLGILVGDVSGHGRDALPHTTLLRFTLRAYLEAGLSPRESLRAAAPGLERQLGGSFATVVLATYDPASRLLTYACAGHPHPIVGELPPEQAVIAASAPPIGAGRSTGTRQTVVSLPGSAVACFFTDGVIEARVGGELFGDARLAQALRSLGSRPSAGELLDRVAELTDRRPDDMAACLSGVDGEPRTPRVLSEELLLEGRHGELARARRFLRAVGLPKDEIDSALRAATALAAGDGGAALLHVDLGGERPRVTPIHDNIAPLRARAISRQEVAL